MDFKVHTVLQRHETHSTNRYVDNRITVDAKYPKFTRCANCGSVRDTNVVGFNHMDNYHHQCSHCYHVTFVNTHNDEGIFKVVSCDSRDMPTQSLSRGQIEALLASDETGPRYLENLSYIETMVKAMRSLEVMSAHVKSLFDGSMTDDEFVELMRDTSYGNPLTPAFEAIKEEYELDRRYEQEFINNSEKGSDNA